jgi:N-formylglutamate deformylase
MRLPLCISVPHAGQRIPPELQDLCILRRKDILADCDAGADTIYFPLREHAAAFSTTDVARSLVDLNRAPDDKGGNGVIKARTCMDVPVYRTFPDEQLIQKLLARYYFPYHEKLSALAGSNRIKMGIDCHTMSHIGPPISPDPGRERPLVCLSNGDGTCPAEWINCLARCFASVFKEKVWINKPFRGGYITRSHADEMPWLQIEISQTDTYSNAFKKNCVLEVFHRFCHTVFGRA